MGVGVFGSIVLVAGVVYYMWFLGGLSCDGEVGMLHG